MRDGRAVRPLGSALDQRLDSGHGWPAESAGPKGQSLNRGQGREFAFAVLYAWLKSGDCDPLGTKPDLARMRCAYVTET